MTYKNILSTTEGTLCFITINRPDKLNALNKETIAELHQVFSEANSNKEVRAVILTGSGEKAFVAGADISEFAHFSAEQGKKLSREGQEKLFNFVENLSKPVIAAINGFALGGGLELAMSCHVRVASDNAKMGLPEVTLGIIPGYGGTQRLAQLVGKGKAFEMITTAEMISAEESLKWKLINHITPQSNLIDKCKEIAAKMAKNSPAAISRAITAINAGFTEGNGYHAEIEEFSKCFGTEDFKEGTSAFLEKRKANFPGK